MKLSYVFMFSIDVLEDTEVATVIFAGQSQLIEHIHLLSSAFIQVGGVFIAELEGVGLVAGMYSAVSGHTDASRLAVCLDYFC